MRVSRSFTLEIEDLAMIEEIAKREGISLNAVLERFVREGIEKTNGIKNISD